MSDFSLPALVREVIATTDLTSPRDVAAKVAESVPSRELRGALAEALASYVRVEFHRDRPPLSTAPTVPTANRSAKVASIRQHAESWRRTLQSRLCAAGEWLLLKDCSYEHLTVLATERRRAAAENVAAAEMYERFAEAVESAGVDRFGDLPDETLRALLSSESEAAA